jgi:transposase-like protein
VPFKNEKPGNYIKPKDDRRRKLSEADKERIRELYKLPDWSQRRLAGEFGVSRRLIQFVVDPEKEARNKKAFAERQKDGRYYDRETHNEAVKQTRRHRQELYLKGELEIPLDTDGQVS